MKIKNAFTLIEIAAVMMIILLIVSIAVPILNKGGTPTEAKLSIHAIQSLISLTSSIAKSTGKIHMIDTDMQATPTYEIDDSEDNTKSKRLRFSVMRIYVLSYDMGIKYTLVDESYDVPFSMAASYSFHPNANGSDHIYFKPDGQISSDVVDIMVCPEKRRTLYYKLEISKQTGGISIKSYKD